MPSQNGTGVATGFTNPLRRRLWANNFNTETSGFWRNSKWSASHLPSLRRRHRSSPPNHKHGRSHISPPKHPHQEILKNGVSRYTERKPTVRNRRRRKFLECRKSSRCIGHGGRADCPTITGYSWECPQSCGKSLESCQPVVLPGLFPVQTPPEGASPPDNAWDMCTAPIFRPAPAYRAAGTP